MLKRMLSLIMMILLVIPAAYATGAAANDEDLLSALDAANSTEQLFERHTSQYRHESIYSGGELLVEIDRYYDTEHVYYIFGKDYSCYITPTGFIQYWADNGALEMLMMPPEEYPEKLESYPLASVGIASLTAAPKPIPSEAAGAPVSSALEPLSERVSNAVQEAEVVEQDGGGVSNAPSDDVSTVSTDDVIGDAPTMTIDETVTETKEAPTEKAE